MEHSRACSSCLFLFFIKTILVAQAPTVLNLQNPAAIRDIPSLSGGFSGFAFSDPVSLKAFGERWQGDFTPRDGEQGFLGLVNASAAYQESDWECRLWHQQRLLMLGNRDTVEFLRHTKTREDLPVGRTYELSLSTRGFRRTGATISRAWTLSESDSLSWHLGVGGKGWFADQAQNGSVSGRAQAIGPRNYDFDLDVNYQYTKNLLYDLPVPTSNGMGIGGTFGMVVRAQAWIFEAVVDDLGSRTWWNALPFTQASAKSGRQHSDSSGYTKFDPTIEGLEGERDWVQTIPSAWMARATWDRNSWQVGVRVERVSNIAFPALEGSLQCGDAGWVGLSYESRTRSWGLGWTGNHVRIGLSLQAWDLARTRSIGLSLGWSSGRPSLK